MTSVATPPDVRASFAALNDRFMSTFARGDAAGVAAMYASDGCAFPPGAPPVAGAAALEAFWRGAIDLGVKAVQLETEELELHGPRAIEVGRFTLSGEGGATLDHGKYLVVWRQESGDWRIYRDIWNSNGAQ